MNQETVFFCFVPISSLYSSKMRRLTHISTCLLCIYKSTVQIKPFKLSTSISDDCLFVSLFIFFKEAFARLYSQISMPIASEIWHTQRVYTRTLVYVFLLHLESILCHEKLQGNYCSFIALQGLWKGLELQQTILVLQTSMHITIWIVLILET